ncbi:PQQ-dependent sugar dehydrogenase [Negadavirga shengliensis]|uniref:PQQ-dependent sugar dehydrogenase n=1 Tax=Negadavirga shengliensis TaxID=1389218 RepID=A0ABV9T1K1_9BACT
MKRLLYALGFVTVISALVIGCADDDFWDTFVPETDETPTQSQNNTFVFIPALVEATEERVQQLEVPQGFQVKKFAEGIEEPRMILANPTGQIYVANREAGQVLLLEDTNGDGTADRNEVVAEIPDIHDFTINGNSLYMVTIKEIYQAEMNSDGTLRDPTLLVDNLPDGGQHPNRTIAIGPDGMLYISVGSTCNACPEPNELHATMLRANADGSDIQIYATGLRNTIGFDWHPETGEFWGMDHNIDMLGDNEPLEELNKIVENGFYGWPFIYDDGKYNPFPRPEDKTYAEYRDMTEFPALMYTAHSAPMAMVFYEGTQFPADYNGDAFVAFRGSWNRSAPVGYKVSRIRFENGQPTAFEDFLTGFLVNGGRDHFARPVGLTVTQDGTLLMSDDTNGVIYSVTHP